VTRYDWLLSAYPREFRRRFGTGMRAALEADHARAQAQGRIAGLAFLLRAFVHAVWFGIVERLPRPVTMRSFLSVDVRDAVRALRATPIVTAAAVLSLALGIGANTALFSILNSLVLRELPVRDPAQLAVISNGDWTNPIWEQIRDRGADLFDSACAWSPERFNLADAGKKELVDGYYVSGGLFQTLGVATVVGRPLTPADDVRGGGSDGSVAVIGHRLWKQRFGGDLAAIGRRLSVNRVPFTIVGVAPPGFFGPEVGRAADVFLPLAAEAAIRGRESALDARSSWWLEIMIRRRSDQSLEAAMAALNAARPAIRDATMPQEWPAEYRAGYLRDEFTLVDAASGVSGLRNRFERPLTIIMAVVVAVLLIACANIANLMLARATARRHELSLRLALGASRTRLACQLLFESLLLAVGGTFAGFAVAHAGAAVLIRQLGSEVSTVTLDLTTDWRVLGFTAGAAIVATLVSGLAPALGVSSVEPNGALKEHGRSVAGDRRVGVRSALVIAQVALSFALIAGAALFLRTFTTLVRSPLGFEPEGLLIATVDASRGRIAPEQLAAFGETIADAAGSVPGVSRASLSFMTPMSGQGWNNRTQVIGGPTLSRTEQMSWMNAVAPGWFTTYGMQLLAGRDFTPADATGSEPVVIVNEAFVRRFVAAGNVLGQRVTGVGMVKSGPRLIVGVVNDAVYRTARAGMVPIMYLPMRQAGPLGSSFVVTVRLTSGRQLVERSLMDAIHRSNPALAFTFRDYSDQVRATMVQERLLAMVSGFFGALALVLAAIGLYGVTSYSVNRRRPEIAVRMALGSSTGAVVRLVLRGVGTLLVAGAALGVAVSLWAAKFVGPLVFGSQARDPVTLTVAVAVLLGVGIFAGWLPARKASRLDPASALKI
jgi:putative ABC transport system permease protein